VRLAIGAPDRGTLAAIMEIRFVGSPIATCRFSAVSVSVVTNFRWRAARPLLGAALPQRATALFSWVPGHRSNSLIKSHGFVRQRCRGHSSREIGLLADGNGLGSRCTEASIEVLIPARPLSRRAIEIIGLLLNTDASRGAPTPPKPHRYRIVAPCLATNCIRWSTCAGGSTRPANLTNFASTSP